MDILNDNVSKIYGKYLFPSLLSASAISIFGFVDMLAIGQGVGANGVAAFSLLQPMLGVTSFLGVFIGMGTSIPMAIAKGQGNMEKSNALFTASLAFISMLTILIWGTFCIFTEEIYILFGANDLLMPYVKEYGNWFIGFLPFFFFSLYLSSIVQVDGAPSLVMKAVMISGVFNVIGDLFLVFVMDMGMKGAAIATVLSNFIQTAIYIGYLFSKRSNVKPVRPYSWIKGIKKISIAGFSTGIIDIAYIILTILLNNLVLMYGNETDLAVFGVAYTCNSMFQRLFGGTGRASQPILSTNFGAGKSSRIKKALKLGLITEISLGLAFTSIGVLFPITLAKLFIEPSPEIIAVAPEIIPVFFLSFIFMGVNMLATYYLQSIMKSLLATIIALLRGIILSGILVIVLPMLIGLNGIWWGMALTELLTAAVSIICFIKSKKWLGKYSCSEPNA